MKDIVKKFHVSRKKEKLVEIKKSKKKQKRNYNESTYRYFFHFTFSPLSLSDASVPYK